jgi:hypothetical protein
MAAHDAGLFTTDDASEDAARVVSYALRKRAEQAQAERLAAMRGENIIRDVTTLTVGQRVFSVICNQYGTVVKINKVSCLVAFDRQEAWTRGRPFKHQNGSLNHRSWNDLKAEAEQEPPRCTT